MEAKSLDLKVAAAVASATLLLVVLGVNNAVLRTSLGVPLTLVLPGYTLVVALFPGYTLRGLERFLLSLGLSLVVAALGGFMLNLLPWGLQPTPWACLLGGITLAASLVAYRRRAKALHVEDSPWYAGMDRSTGLLLGLFMVVAMVALWGARTGAMQQPGQDFTQLWVLPSSTADATTLRVGIHNVETEGLTYHLQVVQGDRLIQDWPSITLVSDNTWEAHMALPADLVDSEPVVVRLYRLDKPDVVYRQGIFWPRR